MLAQHPLLQTAAIVVREWSGPMTIVPTRRKLAVLLTIIAVVSTLLVLAFVHDNPAGLTPITDIDTGAVAPGENVIIEC
jgi:hypothetical protein